jgi:predicted RNA-binding Zn-ribbon protein involved in translation (DUF1610 family)
MPLTCGCDYSDDGDYAWYWRSPDDFSTLSGPRRKRCTSCHQLINIGATVIAFERFRLAKTDIEERIYGESGEIALASQYLCEHCGDLFFSLSELGYCVNPYESMRELLGEYVALKNTS